MGFCHAATTRPGVDILLWPDWDLAVWSGTRHVLSRTKGQESDVLESWSYNSLLRQYGVEVEAREVARNMLCLAMGAERRMTHPTIHLLGYGGKVLSRC